MLVVGSMVGAGVFSLPGRFAQETGVLGALVSWLIAGTGMLMLALVFQALAVRRPELDAGVYAYAKAGFGEYLGFFSAFGYWASACVGNVTYWVLIMSTVGALVPALGDGDTALAVVLSSAGLWGFFLLVRRGVREAAMINRVVTVAKLVPILVFVVLALFCFKADVCAANFRGASYAGSLYDQVHGTMLATVFVFLGVEGASVYSRHARRRSDVGRATVLGFLSVFAVFASVTVVSYGLLPMSEIAALRQPSMAGVLEAAVGTWGKVLVSVGLIVSVLGAYLAWTLMAAEVLFVAAKDEDMPRFLARTTGRDVPVPALLLTTALSQVMLVVTVFSDDAFDFALDLTSTLSLIPYLLAAGYAVRVARQDRSGTGALLVAGLATGYTAFLVYAAGWAYLLVSFIVYAPATVLFVMARREQGRRLFSPREAVVLAVSAAGAVLGVVALAAGWISL
ncbi:basic amino acid/polyamine antiporter [Kitasatospora sp. NRRL B-11411]|uniref:basic amino acid/polyamine antiporter n=1 Tax=Kitasatospora sp. NRRL B-11411 TaxID=1463822 RepID=UPI00350FF92B